MTLQEKIIELLPKRAGADDKAHHPQESEEQFYSYNDGYNQALADVKEKLPEILELIREEVEKFNMYYRSVHSADCSRGETEEERSVEMIKLKEVLELLK